MIEALFTYEFMQNAAFAGILSSIICAVIGVIMVERRDVMLSGGIAHSAYGGVGLSYLIGINPTIGASVFSLIFAFLIGFIGKRAKAKSDVLSAIMWSFGMAMGVIFIGLMKAYPPDVNSYLFGNILSVNHGDLWVMGALALIVLLVMVVYYNDWKSFLFDKDHALLMGLKVNLMEYTYLVLMALTVVVLIKATGIILVIALLSIPAATSGLLTKTFSKRMIVAGLFGVFFTLFGLFISYEFSIASGASIVITAVLTYLVVFLIKKILRK